MDNEQSGLNARQAEIHAKGFNLFNKADGGIPINQAMLDSKKLGMSNYEQAKLGKTKVDDAILDAISPLIKASQRQFTKEQVYKALADYDLKELRNISDYFFRTNKPYERLIKYLAGIYKYDWYISPVINDNSLQKDKILTNFNKSLNILENFQVKQVLTKISIRVLKDGCYYGYIIDMNDGLKGVQDLPLDYCRSAWSSLNKFVVEFNLQYFDKFKTDQERERVLKVFPEEFRKNYKKYKDGTLQEINKGDKGWIVLDPKKAFKFNLDNHDIPYFAAAIPALMDLKVTQGVNQQKILQKLCKMVVQKLPLDSKGELIFEIDEVQQIHNNAVQMLANAIGVEVLTTFADVSVEEIAEDSGEQADDLENSEKNVYNEAGTSQLLFNADNSVALEKSIINDESTVNDLIQEYELFLNALLNDINKNKKKIDMRVRILPTTIYNYKEYYKDYKELSTLGYSRQLPMLALGISQQAIINDRKFEQLIGLDTVMVPPESSNTTSGAATKQTTNKSTGVGAGRKTNEEKGEPTSEKTLKNIESKGNG